MKTSIFLGLFIVLGQLAAADEANSAAQPPIRVAAFSAPPFIYQNDENNYVGIDVDIVEALAARLNRPLIYVACPWKRCLESMRAGRLDLITSAYKNAERENYIRFFPSYDSITPAFYVRKGEALRIANYEDLYRLRIGTESGAIYFDRFDGDQALLKYDVSNKEQLMKMLLEGRLDAYAGYRRIDHFYINQLAMSQWIEQAEYRVQPRRPLHMGISRKSALLEDFDNINDVLQALIAEGVIDGIKRKHEHAQPSTSAKHSARRTPS